jgi:hypothetical protein
MALMQCDTCCREDPGGNKSLRLREVDLQTAREYLSMHRPHRRARVAPALVRGTAGSYLANTPWHTYNHIRMLTLHAAVMHGC